MSLRSTTLANAANRRRCVTPEAAGPYLNDRERKNLQHVARQVNEQIARAFAEPQCGTAKRCDRALKLQFLASKLVRIEEALARTPTPGEAKTAKMYRLVAA
jgi:hypothetical protein